jgi:hypothetical protein
MLLIQAGIVFSCSTASNDTKKTSNPELLHRSMKAITDRIVYDIFSPPVASRIYAYSSVAAYEAMVPSDKNYVSLSGQLKGLNKIPRPDSTSEYCYPLASVQAALVVGKALVFSEDKIEEFHSAILEEFKEAGISSKVFDRSIKYGSRVAEHILLWSSEDNYKQSRSFPKYTILVSNPATWRPTPPAYMDAVEPHWNKIRTFVIDSAQQFKPVPPLTFSIIKTSEFYKEAEKVYKVGKSMTNEQREIAFFWDCNPFVMNVKGHVMFATKKISPGGHWMNITRVACNQVNASFMQAAEAYVRVSLCLADGFISAWDEKYRSVLIRPETYIDEYIDQDWTPLLQTPPFPEYTSAHSVISGAASVVLTKIMGDNFAFTDSTEVEFGMSPRKFKSFFEASDEAAISRMYGGIHYLRACEVGKKQGREIGYFIDSRINTHIPHNQIATSH